MLENDGKEKQYHDSKLSEGITIIIMIQNYMKALQYHES